MARNADADWKPWLVEGVMAAVRAVQDPAVALEDFHPLSAGDRLHTAKARTRAPFSRRLRFLASAVRDCTQPSMASAVFRFTASRVSPWEPQPGMAGTSDQ